MNKKHPFANYLYDLRQIVLFDAEVRKQDGMMLQ